MKTRSMTFVHGAVLGTLVAAAWLLGAANARVSMEPAIQLPLTLSAPASLQPVSRLNRAQPLDLKIMNPTLASLELEFQPSVVMTAATDTVHTEQAMQGILDAALDVPASPDREPQADELTPRSTTLFDLARIAPVQKRTEQWLIDSGIWANGDAGGWADGTNRAIVPLPGLQWQTDWNSRFSLQLSHQAWGESTDFGVMGRVSIDF